MNLIELVDHLRNSTTANKLLENEAPEIEEGLVDIYLLNEFLTSEIIFFDMDKVPEKGLIFEVDGSIYINLFPFSMTQEMVEEYATNYETELSDIEIAELLLDYRINDA
jgi:hypothetical protein